MKKKRYLSLLLFSLLACKGNRSETEDSLSKSDIEYIRSLNIVDSDEKIYKFYSEFKKKNAGNFYTDKRIAKYWIDERSKDKNQIFSAFYPEIKSIDTVYNPGATFCPHMLITKLDGTQFKVCADGKREEIKTFFEDALKLWQQKKIKS
jgi:hypothetical protein